MLHSVTHSLARTPIVVRHAWTKYNAQLIHDDIHGCWYAFTLTTARSADDVSDWLEHRIYDVVRNRYGLLPTSSRSQWKRFGICVFLLPAISRDGLNHFHGMIRVPRRDPSWTKVWISEYQSPVDIDAPDALDDVFATRVSEHGTQYRVLPNLHILADDNGRALDLRTDITTTSRRVLQYWTNVNDGEIRDFADARFIPQCARLALPHAVARVAR